MLAPYPYENMDTTCQQCHYPCENFKYGPELGSDESLLCSLRATSIVMLARSRIRGLVHKYTGETRLHLGTCHLGSIAARSKILPSSM